MPYESEDCPMDEGQNVQKNFFEMDHRQFEQDMQEYQDDVPKESLIGPDDLRDCDNFTEIAKDEEQREQEV